MTPERWATIERLYHAALEHDADRRETLLREACAGDDHLREEVESLLRYGDKAQAGDFPRTSEAAGLTAQLSAVASVVRRLHEPPAPGGFVGRSFGPYEATTLIAAGGMGEVYRAADRRLDRTVAIKILPEHLAADPERRERFGREARIVGTLNHPHICSLYDIGVQDGVPYLVMEFVDGETLEARIRRGPVPWPESLEHLRQIADALDKAHRHGIVHRDLKPANVMLTRAGVKLLDFGLAAWIVANDRAAVTGSAMDGGKRLTGEGRIMGTAHYLSPEQLQGKQPDARSDIFAFGVLAYEMLAGRPAFEGESHAALIGAILKDEPQPMTERVPDLPDAIARTIARCLSKDPDDRWQTANDLSFQLRSMISASDRPFPTDARQPSRWRERAVWTAAIVACLVLAAFIWERVPPIGVGDNRLPVRVSFAAPDGEAFAAGFDTPFAVAPDGRSIAFVSTTAGGTRQLWIRSLQNEHQEAVPGTEGARDPFWSPDSQWIGFFEAATLKKVRVSSGLTQVIARNVSTIGGASWNTDDTILFPSGPGGLSRVASVGGTVMPATRAAAGGHLWPQFLGNGRHFIYIAGVTRSIEIGSLDDDSSRTLMVFPIRPSALAYASGYVFYVNDNVLFARPFDERRLDFSGEPTRVAEGVPVMGPGRARFSVSAAGVLAYWPHPHGLPARLRWFDRAGHPSSAVDTPALYQGFGLSPNGDRLVFSRTDKTGGADLWLRDPVRHAETQLTFDRHSCRVRRSRARSSAETVRAGRRTLGRGNPRRRLWASDLCVGMDGRRAIDCGGADRSSKWLRSMASWRERQECAAVIDQHGVRRILRHGVAGQSLDCLCIKRVRSDRSVGGALSLGRAPSARFDIGRHDASVDGPGQGNRVRVERQTGDGGQVPSRIRRRRHRPTAGAVLDRRSPGCRSGIDGHGEYLRRNIGRASLPGGRARTRLREPTPQSPRQLACAAAPVNGRENVESPPAQECGSYGADAPALGDRARDVASACRPGSPPSAPSRVPVASP
jgi:hypothetical protein